MSILVIFAPHCAGNHLANMIGASNNLDNCLSLQELEVAYQNDDDPEYTHISEDSFFISLQDAFNYNSIYIGHLDEVWDLYDRLEDTITDVLVVELNDKALSTIRSRYEISHLESFAYTKKFIKKLFPTWNVEAIHVNDLLSYNGDTLKFILESNNFTINNRCAKLHDMWLEKIKDNI